MHNIKEIKNNLEDFKNIIKTRNVEVNINEIESLDKKNRKLIQDKEKLENEKKIISKTQDKSLFNKSKEISIAIDKIAKEQSSLNDKLVSILSNIPNLPLPDVPIGKNEESNKEIETKGKILQRNC